MECIICSFVLIQNEPKNQGFTNIAKILTSSFKTNELAKLKHHLFLQEFRLNFNAITVYAIIFNNFIMITNFKILCNEIYRWIEMR
jgi:hypothetical protein